MVGRLLVNQFEMRAAAPADPAFEAGGHVAKSLGETLDPEMMPHRVWVKDAYAPATAAGELDRIALRRCVVELP